MSKIYHSELLILESHLDSFGHVNNAAYLTLFEQVRWEWIGGQGVGLEYVQKNQIGPVILELNLEFKKELLCREIVKVESRFIEMKNPLVMEIEQKMFKPNGDLATRLTLKVGVMDMKARKLIRPPEIWLKALGADV
jgi:YbgC/YbaW family acyl-CoA thioester hydrolase